MDGGGGADTLDGGAGNDWLVTRDTAYAETKAVQALGGEGDDTVQVLGVYGRLSIDGGAGTDWLSFEGSEAFTNLGDNYMRYRSAEGVGVNVDLSQSLGWTYYWGTGTWIDELGRLSISNIENLRGTAQGDRLVGTAGSNAMEGQSGNDWMDGGGGADTLDGGWGLDTLTGGDGSDRFVMSASLAASNADTVTDFSLAQGDTLALDDAVFTLLAGKASLANHFRLSTQVAVGGDDYLVYNPSSGALSYDASGNGTGVAQLFATLANKPQDMTAAQFVVI